MGLKSKRKGKRAEREIVALALSHGLAATREWHRAASTDPNDRVRDIQVAGDYYQLQISAHGFERSEWLVALRAADYLALLSVTETHREKQAIKARHTPKIPTGGALTTSSPIVPLGGKRCPNPVRPHSPRSGGPETR